MGFNSVRDAVNYVTSGYQRIYKGGDKSLLLVRSNGKGMATFVQLIPDETEHYYRVNTVLPIREDFVKNKTLLWERAQSSQTLSSPPSAVSGQSKVFKSTIAPDSPPVKKNPPDAPRYSIRPAKDPRKALDEMEPVHVDTTAFGDERDRKRLRIVAQRVFNQFVKKGPVQNEIDGRSIHFSFSQFGKPKSHSADPRMMRIVPALPEMLRKAIPIESTPEHNAGRYRNIKAWHTYAARADLDGQPLYVQLTTFETKDGREHFSLYHDHNITPVEIMKKGLLAGPDPVTNRGVTQEALQGNTLYKWYHRGKENPPEGEVKYSINPSGESRRVGIAHRCLKMPPGHWWAVPTLLATFDPWP